MVYPCKPPTVRVGYNNMFNLATKLFPEGPPTFGAPWVVSTVDDVGEFVTLLEGLFKKNEEYRDHHSYAADTFNIFTFPLGF